MEKAQVELFRAIRSGDIPRAKKAYDKGANVNWPLDRWLMNGRQHWGLRVQVKPLGIYLGFSARETWMVPVGEGADRGDTLIMVALKCRMPEAVTFLASCDRLNMNCLNEAGNSAMHIARATHQESLLQGGALPPPAPGGAAGAGYQEAVPAWEREAAAGAQFQNLEQQQHQQQHQAGGVGGQDVVYASVVAETVAGGGTGAHGGAPVYATAQPVGEVDYAPAGSAQATVVGATAPPIELNGGNPPGGRRQHNPYDPADGGGRARLHHGRGVGTGAAGFGTGAFGAF
eukprot:jgi/Undpi1/12949/HiC_scaffold_7.g02615.m1